MAIVVNTQRQPYYGISHISTAYVNSGLTRSYNDSLQKAVADADLATIDYLYERKEIRRLFALVSHARAEGADWDDQEGETVLFETARRAQSLLIDLARRAEVGRKRWTSPAISATPDGGIHFSWLVAGSRVTLTVFAPIKDTVCVSKLRGGASRREMLPDYGAVDRVLQAFEASPRASSEGIRSASR